jgi:hypothetical protein
MMKATLLCAGVDTVYIHGMPETVAQTGWWTLAATCDLTDEDREHIAAQIRDGFTEGQIVHYENEG